MFELLLFFLFMTSSLLVTLVELEGFLRKMDKYGHLQAHLCVMFHNVDSTLCRYLDAALPLVWGCSGPLNRFLRHRHFYSACSDAPGATTIFPTTKNWVHVVGCMGLAYKYFRSSP